jgi:hypothetical protein
MKRRFKAPSPALVISLIALFVALGGTSIAATKAITAKHKDKKADTKLIKKLAPSLSVKHAKTANSATNASHASTADTATSATNATQATNATHATSADSATTAGDAATVNHMSVRKVAIMIPVPSSGATTTTLFTLAGLTITHSCSSTETQALSASASEEGILKLITTDDSGTNPFGFEKFEFGPTDGTVNMYTGIPDSENVMGRLVWQTGSGKILTFEFQDETNAISFPPDNCVLGGTVVSG